MDYIAILHQEGDSDFGVSFPDFPGCVTAGKSLSEAKDLAKEALTEHITILREMGEVVILPTSLDDIMQDTDNTDGIAFLVSVPSDKTKRINITIPEDTLLVVDKTAKKMEMSRSAFFTYAAMKIKENSRKNR